MLEKIDLLRKRFSPEFGELLRRRRKTMALLSVDAHEDLESRFYIEHATLGSPTRFHDQSAFWLK